MDGTGACRETSPINTRRRANVGLMLGLRRRRCPSIKPALVRRLVFVGRSHDYDSGMVMIHNGGKKVEKGQAYCIKMDCRVLHLISNDLWSGFKWVGLSPKGIIWHGNVWMACIVNIWLKDWRILLKLCFKVGPIYTWLNFTTHCLFIIVIKYFNIILIICIFL